MVDFACPITRRHAVGVLATPLIAPLLAGCGADRLLSPERLSLASDDVGFTLIGAGDAHAKSNFKAAQRTGQMLQRMLDQNPDARAFALGDNTAHGTVEEFGWYDQTWGGVQGPHGFPDRQP